MKLFINVISGMFFGFMTGGVTWMVVYDGYIFADMSNDLQVRSGIIVGIIALFTFLCFVYLEITSSLFKFTIKGSKATLQYSENKIADVVSYAEDAKDSITSKIEEKNDAFFEIAGNEIDNNEMEGAAWAKALVKAKGDENQRKVEYIKVRVRQLKRGK